MWPHISYPIAQVINSNSLDWIALYAYPHCLSTLNMDKPAVMHLVKQKIGMVGMRAKPLDNLEA